MTERQTIYKDRVLLKCPKCKGEVHISKGPTNDILWADSIATCKKKGSLCWVGTIEELSNIWINNMRGYRMPPKIWAQRKIKRKRVRK
jgi:hypothetical protein